MQRRHRPAGHAVTGIEVMPAVAKFEDSACLTQERFRRSAAKKKSGWPSSLRVVLQVGLVQPRGPCQWCWRKLLAARRRTKTIGWQISRLKKQKRSGGKKKSE